MAVRRNYRINLRNYGNPPAIMVSQYDENYDLVFEVYDGVVPATGLNAYTVKLVGRQPGEDPALKYEFTGTVSGIANNILSFTIDTTMTGRAGKGTAEIVILDTTNDVKFASFNLPVYVEKAAVPDDAIDADVERAQEIADEVQDIVDTAASEVKGEAEAWAVGQRDGVDVPSTDPAYENNAKYYAQRAAQTAEDISGVTDQVAQNTSDIGDLKEDLEKKIIGSANLLNTANNVPNTYIKQTTGAETPYTGWQSSEYIPIDPTESYYFVLWNSAYWNTPNSVYYAFYDSNKVYTHGNFTDSTQGYVMQSVSGDAYLRVSAQNANMTTSRPMVGKVSDLEDIIQTTDVNNYIPYGNALYKDTVKATLDDYIASNDAEIETINDNLKSVAILLPSTVYIAVGRQITFYKPNYLRCKNPDDYVCYWSTSLANTRFDENIRFQPSATGTYLAQLFVMNRYNGETVAQKNMNIVVVADTTRTGKKVLFIGDSLTAAGFYPYEIQKHLSNEGVESIGTITANAYLDSDPAVTTRVSVNHEGRGGWSAQDYITKENKSGVTNAFWNPNTAAFDFSYYLTNNGYSLPDIVFVNLGTNGTVNPTAEVNAIKTIINSIRTCSATVPIVVSAIACGNATQDSYIDIYLTQIREKQLAEFDGVMSNVYVAPIYLNINRMTDWKTETVAESSRNPNEVTRQTDSVHPSKYGYFKFADVYWSVMQAILA